VDSERNRDRRLTRKVNFFLCRKLTAETLKAIGEQFNTGDSAVAHSYSSFLSEIQADRRLRKQVIKIERAVAV
jgi:chromosomal replication initiation ATPase DnaA